MSSAATLIARALELVDTGDLAGLEEIVDPHEVSFELDAAPPMGLAEFQAFQRSWAAAFPDQRHAVTTIVDAGEVGAVEGVFTATHRAELALPAGAVPASGAAVRIGFCIVASARDGRLVRAANHFDALGLLGQMKADPGLRDSKSPAATGYQ
jgi:predicted ester cyclase